MSQDDEYADAIKYLAETVAVPDGPAEAEMLPPPEICQAADRALDGGGYEEIEYEGEMLWVVAEAAIKRACKAEGIDFGEAIEGSWSMVRADGRKVYIWKLPPSGRYGAGAKGFSAGL